MFAQPLRVLRAAACAVLPRSMLGKLAFMAIGPMVLAGGLTLLTGWVAFNVAHHSARYQASLLADALKHQLTPGTGSLTPASVRTAQALFDNVQVFVPQDLVVVDRALRVVQDERAGDARPPLDTPVVDALARAMDNAEVNQLRTVQTDGSQRLRTVVPLHLANGKVIGAMALDYTLLDEVLHDIAMENVQRAGWLCALGLVLMGGLATWLSRPMVSTVRRLTAAATALQEGRHEPIGHYPTDELGQLARTFDNMSIRLEAGLQALQQEVRRREQAQADLEALNEALEQRVIERTASLQATNEQLDAELTRRKRIEGQLEKLARYDTLTGLPNRSLFLNRLELALHRADRNGTLTCLFFVDLDRFKSVNDTLGHDVGDQVLQEAAQRLTHVLRQCDTVSRIGGDEFTVIVEDLHAAQDAAVVAQKIVDALAPPVHIGSHEIFVSASIGIATYPSDAIDIGGLMRQADLAMYQTKAEGRNGYRFHSEQLASQARSRMAIESALRVAVERGELSVHYQTRVSAETGAHTGMEALLRWVSPQLGMVSPADFIPVAEDTGLIVSLGEWVLRAACAQHTAWRCAGLNPGVMAVNVSARQFKQPEFVDTVLQACRDTGMPPAQLELELTESMLVGDSANVAEKMQALRNAGIGIAIDDFGTGFSSLNHLKCFPVSKIKIDRSFVRHIDTHSDDAAIAAAIVTLATNLHIAITAEGVETRSQLEQLDTLDCSEYQGFYFSQPVPADSATEMLQRGLRLSADMRVTRPIREMAISA